MRILLTLACVVLLSACSSTLFTNQSEVHEVTISGSDGYGFTGSSVGLSVEASLLAKGGEAIDVPRLDTLLGGWRGSPTLRVGGNTSDRMFWTSTREPRPQGFDFTVDPSGLDKLRDLVTKLNWNTVIGLNLRARNAARASNMAASAQRTFGPRLEAVAIGNEPSVYYPNNAPFGSYFADLHQYRQALLSGEYPLDLQGPEISSPRHDFVFGVAGREVRQENTFNRFSGHFYAVDGCSGSPLRPADLFTAAADQRRHDALNDLTRAASFAGAPQAVVSETNSVNCGGRKGVSDTVASALWALDFTLTAFADGVDEINFHGGLDDCIPYSPICRTADGELEPRPLYFALRALNSLGGGLASVQVSQRVPDDTLRVFAVRKGQSLKIIAINVEDSAQTSRPKLVRLAIPARQFNQQGRVSIEPRGDIGLRGGASLRGSLASIGRECEISSSTTDAHHPSLEIEVPPSSAQLVSGCLRE